MKPLSLAQSAEDKSVINAQSFVVVAMTLMTVAVGKVVTMMMGGADDNA
jgi:hypothetical protein